MSKPIRQPLAFVTATILLIVYAAPTLAICVCDGPTAMSCCTSSAPIPVSSEESGCCSTKNTDLELPILSSPACQQEVIATDLASVVLPKTDTSVRVECTSVLVPADEPQRLSHTDSAWAFNDAPPGVSAPPVFLVNATFLI